MYFQSEPVKTVHNFFKQQRTMNYKNYLKLKKQEKMEVKQYYAAVKIQTAFRGWLVRSNWKLLQGSAIKIQALWRRAIARKRYNILNQARIEKRLQEMLNKMATRIQAAWRGHISRENNFDFKDYKEIQLKNKKLQESIDRINELEGAISGESLEGKSISSKSSNESVEAGHLGSLHHRSSHRSAYRKSIDDILRTSIEELSAMSPARIAELFTHAFESIRTSDDQDDLYSSHGSISNEQKLGKELLIIRDSILDMFPELPDDIDLVRPDPLKVELLREAIKLLRDNIKERELNKVSKYHYLLRTTTIPGVYSDIYTHELTETEKRLKALKFWKPKEEKKRMVNFRGRMKLSPMQKVKPIVRLKESIRIRQLSNGQSRGLSGSISQPSSYSKMESGGVYDLEQYTSDDTTDTFYCRKPRQCLTTTTPPSSMSERSKSPQGNSECPSTACGDY